MEIDSQELIYDELKINVKNKGDALSLINSNKNGNIILKSGNEGYLRVVGGRDTSTNNGIYFESKGSQMFISEKESLYFLSGKRKESIVLKSIENDSEIKLLQGSNISFLLNSTEGAILANKKRHSKINILNNEGDIFFKTIERGNINVNSKENLYLSADKGKLLINQKNEDGSLEINSNGLFKIKSNSSINVLSNSGINFKISGHKNFGNVIFDFLEDNLDFKIKMRKYGNVFFEDINNVRIHSVRTLINSQITNIDTNDFDIKSKNLILKNSGVFQINKNLLLENEKLKFENLNELIYKGESILFDLIENKDESKIVLNNSSENGSIILNQKGKNGNINLIAENNILFINQNNSYINLDRDSNIKLNSYQNIEFNTLHGDILYSTSHGENFIVDFSQKNNTRIQLLTSKRDGKIILDTSTLEGIIDNINFSIWKSFNILPVADNCDILIRSGKNSEIKLLSGLKTKIDSDNLIELNSRKNISFFSEDEYQFNLVNQNTSFKVVKNNSNNETENILEIGDNNFNLNSKIVKISDVFLLENEKLKIDVPFFDLGFLQLKDQITNKILSISDKKVKVEFDIESFVIESKKEIDLISNKSVFFKGNKIEFQVTSKNGKGSSLPFLICENDILQVGNNQLETIHIDNGNEFLIKNIHTGINSKNILLENKKQRVNFSEDGLQVISNIFNKELFFVNEECIKLNHRSTNLCLQNDNFTVEYKNETGEKISKYELDNNGINIFSNNKIRLSTEGNDKYSKIILEEGNLNINGDNSLYLGLGQDNIFIIEKDLNKTGVVCKLETDSNIYLNSLKEKIYLNSNDSVRITINDKVRLDEEEKGLKEKESLISLFDISKEGVTINSNENIKIKSSKVIVGTENIKIKFGSKGYKIYKNNNFEKVGTFEFNKTLESYSFKEDKKMYMYENIDFLLNDKTNFELNKNKGFNFQIDKNRRFKIDGEHGYFIFNNDKGVGLKHDQFIKLNSKIIEFVNKENLICLDDGILINNKSESGINIDGRSIFMKMEDGVIEGIRNKIMYGKSDEDAYKHTVLGNTKFISNAINFGTEDFKIYNHTFSKLFFSIKNKNDNECEATINLGKKSNLQINSEKMDLNIYQINEQVDNRLFFIRKNFYFKHENYFLGTSDEKFKMETSGNYKDIIIRTKDFSNLFLESGKNILLKNENLEFSINSVHDNNTGLLIKSSDPMSKVSFNVRGLINFYNQEGFEIVSPKKEILIQGHQGFLLIDNNKNNICLKTENELLLQSSDEKVQIQSKKGILMESDGINSDIQINSNGREGSIHINSENQINVKSYKDIYISAENKDSLISLISNNEIEIVGNNEVKIENKKDGSLNFNGCVELKSYNNILRISQDSLINPLLVTSQNRIEMNSEETIGIISNGGKIHLDSRGEESNIILESKKINFSSEDDILIEGNLIRIKDKVNSFYYDLSENFSVKNKNITFKNDANGIFNVESSKVELNAKNHFKIKCECERFLDSGINIECFYNENQDSINIKSENGGITLSSGNEKYISMSRKIMIGSAKIEDKGNKIKIETPISADTIFGKVLNMEENRIHTTTNGLKIDSGHVLYSNQVTVPTINIKDRLKADGNVKVEGKFIFQDNVFLNQGFKFNDGSIGYQEGRNFCHIDVNEKTIWKNGILINMGNDEINNKEIDNNRIGLYIKNNEVNDLGLYVEGRGYINRFNTDKIVLKKSKKIKDLDRGEDKEKIISYSKLYNETAKWMEKKLIKNYEGENILCNEKSEEEDIDVKEMLTNLFILVKNQNDIINNILQS